MITAGLVSMAFLAANASFAFRASTVSLSSQPERILREKRRGSKSFF